MKMTYNAYDTMMSIFEKGTLGLKRAELVTSAYGHVLEIGSGTGINLKYYDFKQVNHIILSDMRISPMLHERLKGASFSYKVQEMIVEDIPFEDNSFDTIVVTLVFCSVSNVQKGLSELRRVLKEDGHLIFIEHVLPDHEPLKGLFNTATPVWKHIASGCHLNRDFLESLTCASFRSTEISKFNKSAFVSGKAYKNPLLIHP